VTYSRSTRCIRQSIPFRIRHSMSFIVFRHTQLARKVQVEYSSAEWEHPLIKYINIFTNMKRWDLVWQFQLTSCHDSVAGKYYGNYHNDAMTTQVMTFLWLKRTFIGGHYYHLRRRYQKHSHSVLETIPFTCETFWINCTWWW